MTVAVVTAEELESSECVEMTSEVIKTFSRPRPNLMFKSKTKTKAFL